MKHTSTKKPYLQSGLFRIQGTLGNKTYYRRKGKYYIRKRSSLNKEQLSKDDAFRRSRLRMKEFGAISKYAAYLKNGLGPLGFLFGKKHALNSFASRVRKAFKPSPGIFPSSVKTKDLKSAFKGFCINPSGKLVSTSFAPKVQITTTGEGNFNSQFSISRTERRLLSAVEASRSVNSQLVGERQSNYHSPKFFILAMEISTLKYSYKSSSYDFLSPLFPRRVLFESITVPGQTELSFVLPPNSHGCEWMIFSGVLNGYSSGETFGDILVTGSHLSFIDILSVPPTNCGSSSEGVFNLTQVYNNRNDHQTSLHLLTYPFELSDQIAERAP